MYPIHEVDVLILLAVTIASKRRPAELLEVVAAVDLLQLAVPSETRLVEAFHRLSVHGLIREAEGGYTLTPDAQKVMSGRVPKKADTVERMQVVRARLGDYIPGGGNVPVVVTRQQACAAILAQGAAGQGGGQSLVRPKPTVAATQSAAHAAIATGFANRTASGFSSRVSSSLFHSGSTSVR